MGGNPERLDHLDRLLSTYPNCWLDTSRHQVGRPRTLSQARRGPRVLPEMVQPPAVRHRPGRPQDRRPRALRQPVLGPPVPLRAGRRDRLADPRQGRRWPGLRPRTGPAHKCPRTHLLQERGEVLPGKDVMRVPCLRCLQACSQRAEPLRVKLRSRGAMAALFAAMQELLRSAPDPLLRTPGATPALFAGVLAKCGTSPGETMKPGCHGCVLCSHARASAFRTRPPVLRRGLVLERYFAAGCVPTPALAGLAGVAEPRCASVRTFVSRALSSSNMSLTGLCRACRSAVRCFGSLGLPAAS